jgi:foldase protein PrsA
MKKLALVAPALVLGLAVLAAGCGSKIPQGAIATVDGQPVTQAQFDQYINQAKTQAAQPSQPPFPSAGSTAYKRYAAEIVNYLVTQQIVLNEASKLKLTVTDQDVQTRLQQIATQYGGTQKMYAAAQKAGLNPDQLKTYVKNSLLGQKVYAHVIGNAKPTDKQMRDYYNKNKSQFDKPASRDVRQILVKTKAEALKVRALIAANDTTANWTKVASKYSTDSGSKSTGGLYKGVTPGQMVAPFDKALFSLAKGQLSQPVKTQYGYHILEVVGINAPKASTYESAKATIQSTLASQLQQKAWTDWLTNARKTAAILYAAGYNPDRLTAAPKASPSSAPAGSATPTPAASSTK